MRHVIRKPGGYDLKVNNFVYGDAKRIFVNTDMGCKANCQYCYLSSLDIVHGKSRITANQAIGLVEDLECYKQGKEGSIISIGCYSECMEKENISDTVSLVKHFLDRGNFVQLATKKKIERNFFEEIYQCDNRKEHLWIFISLPIITNSYLIEKGTDSPYKRIETFDMCQQYNVNSVLYIKPYIDGITNKDINQYSRLVTQYNIPAVVGKKLSTKQTKKKTMVGENRLFECKTEGIDEFIHKLEKYTKVYLHSIDCFGVG